MKSFVAFESANPRANRYTFKIYRIKMNQLSYVGSGSIMYSSTRGGESEVMSELARLGEIPKKFESGYYISERKNTFKISYIVPDNQK